MTPVGIYAKESSPIRSVFSPAVPGGGDACIYSRSVEERRENEGNARRFNGVFGRAGAMNSSNRRRP